MVSYFWIPYLNIGTTIGLFVGIISKLSKGETISPTEIFNPDYRKKMGQFFLTGGLVVFGKLFSLLFAVIPAIVLNYAWSQSILLTIDKNLSPIDAIQTSNEVTYGNKSVMFWGYLIIGIVIALIYLLFKYLFRWHQSLLVFTYIIISLLSLFLTVGIQAYVYKRLCLEE
jgi:hypothetical protein